MAPMNREPGPLRHHNPRGRPLHGSPVRREDAPGHSVLVPSHAEPPPLSAARRVEHRATHTGGPRAESARELEARRAVSRGPPSAQTESPALARAAVDFT